MLLRTAKLKDFFNEESICIFTDASFQNLSDDVSIACGITAPSYCVYWNNQCIEQGYSLLGNSNSQQGELYALSMGINAIPKYSNFKNIRIFSDNKNAIFSTREWIRNWVRETNAGRNSLGENGRICNQDYIMNNVYSVISSGRYIEFYHIMGHVDIRRPMDIERAKSMFLRSNSFIDEVDDDLIYMVAMGNTVVDNYSTTMLKSCMFNNQIGVSYPAISFGYKKFDMNEYIGLVNKNGERRKPD